MTPQEAIEVLKNDIEICTIQQKQACDMAIKALESQNRLTEMLNKQINAYVEQNKNRHLSDLEYGRKTAYTHCMEVLENDD